MNKLYIALLPVIIFSFFSTNAQWVSVGTPSMAQSGSVTIDNNSIFVGTSNNGIFRSTNNGDNWDPVNNGLSMNIILTVANNSGRLFASTFSDIVTSADNGDNWSPYYNGLGSGYSAYSFFFEGTSVFASGFGIYYSGDNGANWNRYTNGLPSGVYAVTRKGTNLFAATGGGVFYSGDDGVNWDTSGTGLEGYVIRTIAVAGDNIIAGTDSAGAFISIDNGENWTKVTNGIPLVPRTSVRALIKIGNSTFAGLGYNPNGSWGIYRSTDDGLSWTDAKQGIPSLTGVYGLAANSTHLFASLVGGVYRRPLSEFGITDVEQSINELPSNFILSQNYPNPFNPSTKISWQSSVIRSSNNKSV